MQPSLQREKLLMKVLTSPNECFQATKAIEALTPTIDDYDAVWYLTRVQKELESVVESLKVAVNKSHADLVSASQLEIPPETPEEQAETMKKAKEAASKQLDAVFAEKGGTISELEFNLIPHKILWPRVKPEQRNLVRFLIPFMTVPELT